MQTIQYYVTTMQETTMIQGALLSKEKAIQEFFKQHAASIHDFDVYVFSNCSVLDIAIPNCDNTIS